MLRKSLKDPGFWFLLTVNGYFIYYYMNHPDEFNTLVWVFFIQSLLIGLFNFFTLLSIKNPDPATFSLNKEPVSKNTMGCTAFFFLAHYGFFHFVYFIFLLTDFRKNINLEFILIAAAVFLAESTFQLIRLKFKEQYFKAHIGLQFFIPYLRIVPMHLMILLPAFTGIGTSVIFLILKSFADAGMYLLTSIKSSPPPGEAV